MADDGIAYDKAELRRIVGAFKAMDEASAEAAKKESNALAEFVQRNMSLVTPSTSIATSGPKSFSSCVNL